MFKQRYKYFSNPKKLALLNGSLITLLLFLNTFFQAFCIPSTWAAILLAICFVNTIIYPVLREHTKFLALTSFISGISFSVFTYCVIFLGHINLIGLGMILFGFGLAVFIPHFFVVQLLWKNLIKPIANIYRYYFLSAILISTFAATFIGIEYKEAIISIEKFKQSNYTQLEKSFITEKILGMHFIYHTSYCEFDGWRPPIHEPILVVGMWLNNSYDPLNVDLKTRLKLYKEFFPEKKFVFDCSCGIMESDKYHNDALWK